jgi:hypothetical protein
MTFLRPFVLDGFEGTLPAGTYELQSEQEIVDGMSLPDSLRTSVLIHLHSKDRSPALARTLTVPWDVLESAQIRDQAPAGSPSDVLLADWLADPIVRLVMRSDGVSETEVRSVVKAARAVKALQFSCVYQSDRVRPSCQSSRPPTSRITGCDRKMADWHATDRAENEGMALVPA